MEVLLLDVIFKVDIAVVLANKDEALGDWCSHHKECQVGPKAVVICAVVELIDVHRWLVLVGLDKRFHVFVLPLNKEVGGLKVHKVWNASVRMWYFMIFLYDFHIPFASSHTTLSCILTLFLSLTSAAPRLVQYDKKQAHRCFVISDSGGAERTLKPPSLKYSQTT